MVIAHIKSIIIVTTLNILYLMPLRIYARASYDSSYNMHLHSLQYISNKLQTYFASSSPIFMCPSNRFIYSVSLEHRKPVVHICIVKFNKYFPASGKPKKKNSQLYSWQFVSRRLSSSLVARVSILPHKTRSRTKCKCIYYNS